VKCECGGDTLTKDTRKIEQGIWRRRYCPACKTQFTTLEHRCETVAAPYTSKKGAHEKKGAVIAPAVPKVSTPRARNPAKPKPTPAENATFTPKVRRGPLPITIPPRTDKTYPQPKVVDRLTPTARDRIEDMKFEREQRDHGWDK